MTEILEHEGHQTADPYIDKNNDLKLGVTYRNLSVSYMLNSGQSAMNPILKVPFDFINDIRYHIFRQRHVKSIFHRCATTTGYFKPGESTLVLGPPGSGRSTILKLVTQTLPPTTGVLLFNGITADEASTVYDVDMKKLFSFVDQVDNHFDQLTVYETLEFAHRLLTKFPSRKYIEDLIEVFGMEECTNTLTSATSGGQKRRLSLMLGLCNPHIRCVAMDNLSDGLDHATADNIIAYMCKWARVNNTVFITTLQQPAPTMLTKFDKLILLREGHTVYHGPVLDVRNFLHAMGYPCNDAFLPLVEHIIHVLSHPKVALQELAIAGNATIKSQKEKHNGQPSQKQSLKTLALERPRNFKGASKRREIDTSYGPMTPSLYPCVEVEEMVEFFHESPFFTHLVQVVNQVEAARLSAGFDKTNEMAQCENGGQNGHGSDLKNSSLDTDPGTRSSMITGDADALNPPTDQLVEELMISNGYKTTNSPMNTNNKSTPLSENTGENLQLDPIQTEQTHKYYKPGFTISLYQLFMLVLSRQMKLTLRNPAQIIARLIPAAIIAVVFSGLYFNLSTDQYTFRVASFIDVQTEVAYNNLLELGLFIYYRRLIHSQLNLYPTWAYTTSVYIAGIPYSLIESFVLTIIPYAMIGHSPYGLSMVTHFFILWVHGTVMSAIFRCGASMTADVSMAYALVSPIISIFSLVGGFYVRLQDLHWVFKWIYWISPFAWGLRSLTQLEFLSPRYDYIIPDPLNPGDQSRAGNVYLALTAISPEPIWIMMSVFYCVVVLVFLLIVSSWFLYAPYKEYSIGTRRFMEDDDNIVIDADMAKENDLDEFQVAERFQEVSRTQQTHPSVERSPDFGPDNAMASIEMADLALDNTHKRVVSTARSSTRGGDNGREPSRSRFVAANNKLPTLTNDLPFTPASLAFESMKFTVKAKDDDGKVYDRVLLQNVTGFAQQGTLCALMGSSGAGKSTLANVLMGLYKSTSSQTVGGTIYINGQPVDGKAITHSQFTSITAYVEQFETLFPFDTVFETLLFSARSRLRDVDEETLLQVVEEVMDILELSQVRDLLIGSPEAPSLSPSQKKKVAIGVELIFNPSIIFLDEPTTGLDSEAAASVVRALHNIARSGRAIVCTIHQPSSQLFFHFDSLLLLGSGGYPLFFGRIGKWAKALINYFNNVDGFLQFPGNMNPAEWLVEEVSKPIPSSIQSKASQEFGKFQQSFKAFEQLMEQQKQKSPSQSENINNSFNISQFREMLALDFDSLAPRHQWVTYLYMFYMKSHLWGKVLQYLSFLIPANPQIKNYVGHLKSNTLSTTTPLLIQRQPGSQAGSAISDLSGQSISSVSILNNTISSKTNIQTQTKGSKNQDQQLIISPSEQTIPDLPKHAILPLYRQFYEVTARASHVFRRSSSLFYTRVISSALLSIFFAVFYLNIEVTTPAKLITFMAATVISIGNTTYITATTSLPIYVGLKPVFHRETFSNYYRSFLWPLSFMLNELVWSIPISICCFMPHYFAVGGSTDPLVFFSYWFVVVIMIVMFTQFTLLLSMAVPPQFTEVIQNVYVSLCFSFGNIAMTYPTTNKIYRVLMRIMPFFYVNRAITTQQFKTDTTPISVVINDNLQIIPLNEWITQFTGYSMESGIYWWSLLWLFVTIGSFASVSFFSSIFIRFR